MNPSCIFCKQPLEERLGKPWHMDCLDSAIETEFGVSVYNLVLREMQGDPRDISLATKRVVWAEKLIETGVPEGSRHLTRFKLFLALKSAGYSDSEVASSIVDFNSHCTPPEMENVVRYHIRYLFRWWESHG